MLGDPGIYVFDEPVNGLDPEGVRWFRDLVGSFAAEGRTVFLSSHLISEIALTADHVIVLGRGRVLADAPIAELAELGGSGRVQIRTPQAARLAESLRGLGATITSGTGMLAVEGISAARIGVIAAESGIPLSELRTEQNSLEDGYRALTESAIEYRPGVR